MIQKVILHCPAYTFLSELTILFHEAFKEIGRSNTNHDRYTNTIDGQSKESLFD